MTALQRGFEALIRRYGETVEDDEFINIDENFQVDEYRAIVHALTEALMINDPMLQWFEYAHLKDELQAISRPFGELAKHLVNTLPQNPERTTALRKLLEAKDCAVRASIYKVAG